MIMMIRVSQKYTFFEFCFVLRTTGADQFPEPPKFFSALWTHLRHLAFHPLYEAKISNRSLSVVYGSITLKFFSGALGTSPHQWFNRGNEIPKKRFLGHPIRQSLQRMARNRKQSHVFFQRFIALSEQNVLKDTFQQVFHHIC